MDQNILVAVDIVIFCKEKEDTYVLLIQRKNEPFKNQWALPGGFVENGERLKTTAQRELVEETGLTVDDLDFVGVFDDPDRDPRSRVVSVSYSGWHKQKQEVIAGSDAKNAQWFTLDELPELAFDHSIIIQKAKELT